MTEDITPTTPDKEPKFFDGFKKLVGVYWFLIIPMIILLIGSWYTVDHVGDYVNDVNRQWQTQLQNYYCYPKTENTAPLTNELALWRINTTEVLQNDNVKKRDECLDKCYGGLK